VTGAVTVVDNAGNESTPSIGWLGERYLVAWQDLLGGFNDQVRGVAIKGDGAITGLSFTAPTVAQLNQRSPLLERALGIEVLVCPKCSAVRRVLAASHDPAKVERVLRAMGLPLAVPEQSGCRAPPAVAGIDDAGDCVAE